MNISINYYKIGALMFIFCKMYTIFCAIKIKGYLVNTTLSVTYYLQKMLSLISSIFESKTNPQQIMAKLTTFFLSLVGKNPSVLMT